MSKMKKERQVKIAAAIWQASTPGLFNACGDKGPALSTKQILELEAAKPLKGGAAELGFNSLFGEGMKQGSMF